MLRKTLIATAALSAVLAAPAAHAQSEAPKESFGGARGADLSIEAMEPDGSGVTIGRAGEYPADIARYLLASGAGAAAAAARAAAAAVGEFDVAGASRAGGRSAAADVLAAALVSAAC